MTTKRKRRYQKARPPGIGMSHAGIVQAILADRWGQVDVESHPLLADASPVERAAVTAEIEQLLYAERRARRLEMLRARLMEWKPEYWAPLFSECPELESELTAAQLGSWQGHKNRAASLLTMPARHNARRKHPNGGGSDAA